MYTLPSKNLKKSLFFYEKGIELSQELYFSHPDSLEFKTGFAVFCAKLGMIQLNLSNIKLAKEYFDTYKVLFHELVEEYTTHINLQNNYAEAIAVSNVIDKLIGRNINAEDFLKSKSIFHTLYHKTGNKYFKKKETIIDEMIVSNNNLEKLIIDILQF